MIAAITQEIYSKPKAENTPGTFLPAHDSAQRLAVGKKLHGANMDAFLKESPYDPYIHNGARNPYTGDVIVSEDDYKRYAHEHVYSRECEKILRTHYSGLLSEKENELKLCQKKLEASRKKEEETRNELERSKSEVKSLRLDLETQRAVNRPRRTAVCAILILLLCGIIALLLSTLINTQNELEKVSESISQSRVEANLAKPTAAKPTSTPAQQKQSTSTSSDAATTVYITESGSKYHKANCQYLSKSKKSIDLSKAKQQGYEPCSKCY